MDQVTTPKPKRRFARQDTAGKAQPTARPPRKANTPPLGAPTAVARTTKADTVVALLSRAEGATIEQMMAATAWQAHSVRGFLAGTVKKKAGATLTSRKIAGLRTYFLTTDESATA